MKAVICGGRKFEGNEHHYLWLANLSYALGVHTIISGACSGADSFGEVFAENTGKSTIIFKANWKKHNKVAGLIRNRQMAEYTDVVFAFEGGTGTDHMIKTAQGFGKAVYKYPSYEVVK